MVGIRLSCWRLGSRRSGQSYASNQHRRGNGFNHRHLSDLRFCTYEQNYYPPTTRECHLLSSGGQLNQLGAMSHPRAKTNASCRYLSASNQYALHLFFYFFSSNISITESIYFWGSQRGNDETSLRFSPSFHGPYNLCGSCRQWFA